MIETWLESLLRLFISELFYHGAEAYVWNIGLKFMGEKAVSLYTFVPEFMCVEATTA